MRQISPGRVGRLLTGQSFLGPVNGTNVVFSTTLKFLHTTSYKEVVHLRGLRLLEGALQDYLAVESGGAGSGYDTIVLAAPPEVDDTLQIDFYPG